MLWSVALFRLLVPVSVPVSLSVFTMINDLAEKFAVRQGLSLTQGSSVVSDGTLAVQLVQETIITSDAAPETTLWISPLILIWFGGFTLCMLSFVLPHLRSRNDYKMSIPIEHDFIRKWQQSNQLRRQVQIRQSDTILTPLTYGVVRPVVLLPKSIDYTDEKQLAFILTHEYIHIKQFDVLKKWLLAACLCIHWFNPFVWIMYILANRDIELTCDETVIRTFGESKRSAYAMALVRWEEKKSGLSSMVSHFSKNAIEERIVSIMRTKKVSIAKMLLAVVIVAGSVTFFATSALDKTKAAPKAEIPMAETGSALYQGESSTALMPIDLTFTKSDVPQLIEKLHASKYKAIYVDNEMLLRVGNDNSIWTSRDNGSLWGKFDTVSVKAKDFADWLLKNDPNPGYSMKETQNRLANGAEVKHVEFENGKEMYFIIDENGVQIELVQTKKLASVLIDGQRMMVTSERLPIFISEQMLESFYDLLVSGSVLTKTQAEQDYSERIQYLKENDTFFTVTN
jgi:beta-lactamase regulating signal transducer with metallopeptidase domain